MLPPANSLPPVLIAQFAGNAGSGPRWRIIAVFGVCAAFLDAVPFGKIPNAIGNRTLTVRQPPWRPFFSCSSVVCPYFLHAPKRGLPLSSAVGPPCPDCAGTWRWGWLSRSRQVSSPAGKNSRWPPCSRILQILCVCIYITVNICCASFKHCDTQISATHRRRGEIHAKPGQEGTRWCHSCGQWMTYPPCIGIIRPGRPICQQGVPRLNPVR